MARDVYHHRTRTTSISLRARCVAHYSLHGVQKKRRGCASYHTSFIELESERDKKFDLLLDDQLYGPYSKIRCV